MMQLDKTNGYNLIIKNYMSDATRQKVERSRTRMETKYKKVV